MNLPHLLEAIGNVLIFSILGIALALLAYKVIDWVIPGNMSKQIADGNVAIAIIAGSLILGICIIISTAMS